jgi:hypothetical protein
MRRVVPFCLLAGLPRPFLPEPHVASARWVRRYSTQRAASRRVLVFGYTALRRLLSSRVPHRYRRPGVQRRW